MVLFMKIINILLENPISITGASSVQPSDKDSLGALPSKTISPCDIELHLPKAADVVGLKVHSVCICKELSPYPINKKTTQNKTG